jgi:hypothetical protein
MASFDLQVLKRIVFPLNKNNIIEHDKNNKSKRID